LAVLEVVEISGTGRLGVSIKPLRLSNGDGGSSLCRLANVIIDR
jgi:hypothetical protein